MGLRFCRHHFWRMSSAPRQRSHLMHAKFGRFQLPSKHMDTLRQAVDSCSNQHIVKTPQPDCVSFFSCFIYVADFLDFGATTYSSRLTRATANAMFWLKNCFKAHDTNGWNGCCRKREEGRQQGT